MQLIGFGWKNTRKSHDPHGKIALVSGQDVPLNQSSESCKYRDTAMTLHDFMKSFEPIETATPGAPFGHGAWGPWHLASPFGHGHPTIFFGFITTVKIKTHWGWLPSGNLT